MGNKEYTKTLLERLHAILKPCGFRKKGATFTRTIDDDVALLVNLQKSTGSDSASVRATVNLGVFSFVVSRACDHQDLWRHASATPSIWNCHWRERIGFLMPDPSDRWWTVTSVEEATKAGDEMGAALIRYGLPALDQVGSTDRLRALWARGESPGLSEKQREEYLAALRDPMQWREEGTRRLREALARFETRNAE